MLSGIHWGLRTHPWWTGGSAPFKNCFVVFKNNSITVKEAYRIISYMFTVLNDHQCYWLKMFSKQVASICGLIINFNQHRRLAWGTVLLAFLVRSSLSHWLQFLTHLSKTHFRKRFMLHCMPVTFRLLKNCLV